MSTTIEEIAAKHSRRWSCTSEQRQVFYNFDAEKAVVKPKGDEALRKVEIRRSVEDYLDDKKCAADIDWLG